MWIPDSKGVYPDLLATSGDYLRVWRCVENETRLECILNNVSVQIIIFTKLFKLIECRLFVE